MILGGILLAVFLMLPACCNLQYMFLYHPSAARPSADVLAEKGLAFWPSAGNYRGLIDTPASGTIKGTVIVFHGNGGIAAYREYYPRGLGPLGYRTILAEYPLYGGRGGELGEQAYINDALETIRLASETYGRPIFLLGESMGCGVAAAAANKADGGAGAAAGTAAGITIDGIILFTPWDTLLSLAQSKVPYFPIRLIMKDKYDSISDLKTFKGRIAVIGAELDDIVPVSHALKLYESLPGPKKMWTLKGADHNNWIFVIDKKTWKDIIDYVSSGE